MIQEIAISAVSALFGLMATLAYSRLEKRQPSVTYRIVPDLLPSIDGRHRYIVLINNSGRSPAKNLFIRVIIENGGAIENTVVKTMNAAFEAPFELLSNNATLKVSLPVMPSKGEAAIGFSSLCSDASKVAVHVMDADGHEGRRFDPLRPSILKRLDAISTAFSGVMLLVLIAGAFLIGWLTYHQREFVTLQAQQLQIADLLYDNGKYEEAIQQYHAAILTVSGSPNPTVAFHAARAASRLKRYDDVKKYFDRIASVGADRILELVEVDPVFDSFRADPIGKQWLVAYRTKSGAVAPTAAPRAPNNP